MIGLARGKVQDTIINICKENNIKFCFLSKYIHDLMTSIKVKVTSTPKNKILYISDVPIIEIDHNGYVVNTKLIFSVPIRGTDIKNRVRFVIKSIIKDKIKPFIKVDNSKNVIVNNTIVNQDFITKYNKLLSHLIHRYSGIINNASWNVYKFLYINLNEKIISLVRRYNLTITCTCYNDHVMFYLANPWVFDLYPVSFLINAFIKTDTVVSNITVDLIKLCFGNNQVKDMNFDINFLDYLGNIGPRRLRGILRDGDSSKLCYISYHTRLEILYRLYEDGFETKKINLALFRKMADYIYDTNKKMAVIISQSFVRKALEYVS